MIPPFIRKQISLPKQTSQKILGIVFVTILCTNTLVSALEVIRIQRFRTVMSHQVIGHQFTGMDKWLEDIEIMGYFTNLNMNDAAVLKHFSQAQYVLAPTILEHGSLSHQYTFFNCRPEEFTWRIIRQRELSPLLRNKWGMVLTSKEAPDPSLFR